VSIRRREQFVELATGTGPHRDRRREPPSVFKSDDTGSIL